VSYHLRHLDTGAVVHTYDKEGAALAFLRDVVRLGSHAAARQFVLAYEDQRGGMHTIAEGEALMTRALEDQAED